MTGPFSADLLNFIDLHVDSIELVEVLLLLRDRGPEGLAVRSINDIIRSDEGSIQARLDTLTSMGLVQRAPDQPDLYRYAPGAHHQPVIDELAAAYRERRTKVIELIYSRGTRDLHHFSNAFVWRRKEKKNDG